MRFSGMMVILACTLVLVAGGCAMSGTWRRVEVSPEGAEFAITAITFSRDRFTTTVEEDGQVRTLTGRFVWNGSKLRLIDETGKEHRFLAKKSGGSKLVLSPQAGGSSVRAVLEPVSP